MEHGTAGHAVEIPDTRQGTAEGLQARKAGITATECAAILGGNPYTTPLDVWISKQPDTQPDPPTEAMRWGTIHEPRILEAYAAEVGVWVMDGGGLLQNTEHPWMMASLDGWATSKHSDSPWIVEAKTSGRSWADGPPAHYVAQVQWQMAVTGMDRADIVALFNGNRLQWWTVDRDQEWIDQAIDYCRGWHQTHIVGKSAPEPEMPRDADKLARLWTPDSEAAIEVAQDFADELRDALAQADEAVARAQQLKNELKVWMGEATEARDDAGTLATWRETSPRRTVDTAALKRDGIYEDYMKTGTPGRTFRINRKKNDG